MDENRTPNAGTEAPTLPNMSAKVYPTKDPKQEKGSILAYANVDLGGCFAVNGIKIVEGKEEKQPAVQKVMQGAATNLENKLDCPGQTQRVRLWPG